MLSKIKIPKKLALSVFVGFLPFVVLLTIVFGTIYATVQQSIRLSANNPQIQIAGDSQSILARDDSRAEYVVPPQPVDISKSLSPFIMVFDKDGKLLAGSAQIDGKAPLVPPGVFESVKRFGQERLTWEPRRDVRIAAVVVKNNNKSGGYILVGRSIREVEILERKIEILVFFGWLAALLSTLCALTFAKYLKSTLKI